MIYSAKLAATLVSHMAKNMLKGNKKYPYVLMLEPLFKCNLSCAGCGRIREYKSLINEKLSGEECLHAAIQAGAPVVSVTGGEPLIHPQIKDIIKILTENNFYVYLCTNGLKLAEFLDEVAPSERLSFVVHLDGSDSTHSQITGNADVYGRAIEGIKKAARLNFKVRTNTTVYRNSNPEEITDLFRSVISSGAHSVMVSPAFDYEDVESNIFMEKSETRSIFHTIYNSLDGTRIYNTPLYWDFLSGKRELKCTPWANPTFNPAGWKSPCYLITDRHYKTYKQMIIETDWEKYGNGNDPRCANCMVHSGFEASAISSLHSVSDLYRMLKWSLTGRRV